VPCFLGHLAFFGQPPKCDVAHTSLRLFPIKIRQPGNQEGTHGTKTSYRRRDCSCNGVDHPNGHGVGHAELVTDFRSSTFAFVLRGTLREHVLLFCLLGLVLTATIMLVIAPGAMTWALALIE
jgi:hypothetical protein